MAIMLAIIFWITITGANFPSKMLSEFLFGLEDDLQAILLAVHLPETIVILLVFGMYKVLAWVVSVMLPPMAIFFPLLLYWKIRDICRGLHLILISVLKNVKPAVNRRLLCA